GWLREPRSPGRICADRDPAGLRRPARPPPCRARESRRSDRGPRSRARQIWRRRMKALAASLGFALPGTAELLALAAAAAIAAGTILIAWLAGRWAGPPIAAFWERTAGARAESLIPRTCALVRYLIIWPALLLALRLHAWPPAAAFLLGFVAAGAAALVVRNVVRGVNLPRWVAWALALFLFVAILADAVGGLDKVTGPLDTLAFTIGSRRLSLLALIQMLIAL